ncbi:MAG: response regulator [Nitrospirae bacterium]|nr:response regulator [Candidatus Troglogloeales bacterium]
MSETEKESSISIRPIDILLVEDSEADIVVTVRVFSKAKIKNRLFVVRDGEEALDYIYHQNQYADRNVFPTPHLILLDIRMPKLDGFGVLKRLKEDDQRKLIPVIMLTSSQNNEDVARSYGSGAVSFIQKPIHYEEFVTLVDGFNFYWNIINKLPHRGA